MKSCLTIASLPLIFASACMSLDHELSDGDRAAIREDVSKHFQDFWDSWSGVDTERGFSYHQDHSDYSFAADGNTWNSLAGLQEASRPGFRTTKHQEFRFDETRVAVISRDVVHATWRGTHTRIGTDGSVRGPRPFAFTSVWVRSNGEWKVRFAHQSSRDLELQSK